MLKNKTISGTAVILIVALMVGAAELFSENEIIFPEITALAVGAVIAPRQVWRTSRLRMIILIAFNAVCGVLIVRYLPAPLWVKIALAFFLCQLIDLYSGTTFAPMISAMVLPVLLGTESWVYPFAAVCLTAIILLVQILFEKTGIRQREDFVPVPKPGKEEFLQGAVRVVCVLILSVIALSADSRFCIAPPLLVAFTEFSRRGCKARKTPVKTVMLIFLCALAGSLCRWGLSQQLGLSLTLSAVAATIIMLVLLYCFNQFLPPAGAMTVLAMLIPAGDLVFYPIQVLLGASVLMLLARVLFPEKERNTEEALQEEVASM